MNILFWQNYPNHLQSVHIRALAGRQGCQVTLVTQENIPQWRRGLGWSMPDFGDARLIIGPDRPTMLRILAESESVHIFSAARAYPLVWEAFRHCLTTKARIGILSEPYDWRGPIGLVRLIRGRWDAFRDQARVQFVLAIGHLGVRWFRMSGYPDDKIYPYGYFVERPPNADTEFKQTAHSEAATVNLVFIGQCIHRKGVDILLHALSGLQHLNWCLRIVGDGAEKAKLEALSVRLGLSAHVHFLGAQNNKEAMKILETSDLLVLPSRWDGWGAVVNEALMRGVPVICSNYCGAADLLVSPELGTVVKAGSVASLQTALRHRLAGKNTPARAQQIRAWSTCITGKVAANYLMDTIAASTGQAARPVPPWAVKPTSNGVNLDAGICRWR